MAGRALLRTLAPLLSLALALGLAGPPVSLAAQTPTDTLSLTLEEAQRIAEDNNPAFRQTRNALTLNAPQTRATWMGEVLPSANLTLLNTGYYGTLTKQTQDFFGNPIQNPQSDWVHRSNTRQSLSLQWELQGASIWHALRGQEETNLGRRIDVETARWTLRSEVRRAAFEVLRQRALLGAERALRDARIVELDLTERLFELAEGSRVDLLNAELEVQRQERAVQRQERAHEQAVLALRTVLGDPDLPPIRVDAETPPVFDPSALDVESLVARALDEHPQLRGARSSVRASEIGVDQSRAQWWPALTFSADLGRTAQTLEGDALFDVTPDDDLQSSFYIGLSFPFFNNYFGNRLQMAQARVQLENDEEALRQARLQLRETVSSAMVSLRNEYETLRLAERSLEVAGEALELAREEYRLGARTFRDLQTSVEQEADARRQVIEARHAFAAALVELEDAVGAPVVPPS